jgi:hypothetical protein
LLNDDFQCTVTDSANRVDQTNDVVTPEDVDVLRVNSSRDVLMKEQLSDPTLKACRSMADQCRSGYFSKNGLLCRVVMRGAWVCLRLCSPNFDAGYNRLSRISLQRLLHPAVGHPAEGGAVAPATLVLRGGSTGGSEGSTPPEPDFTVLPSPTVALNTYTR